MTVPPLPVKRTQLSEVRIPLSQSANSLSFSLDTDRVGSFMVL